MVENRKVYVSEGICVGCEYVGEPSEGDCNEVVLEYKEDGEVEDLVSYVAVTGMGELCRMAEEDSDGYWMRKEQER